VCVCVCVSRHAKKKNVGDENKAWTLFNSLIVLQEPRLNFWALSVLMHLNRMVPPFSLSHFLPLSPALSLSHSLSASVSRSDPLPLFVLDLVTLQLALFHILYLAVSSCINLQSSL